MVPYLALPTATILRPRLVGASRSSVETRDRSQGWRLHQLLEKRQDLQGEDRLVVRPIRCQLA
jgi:hypothetical protein